MRGQHKPDCKCRWCEVKRGNIAKKKPATNAEKPHGETSASGAQSNAGGESSKPLSTVNSGNTDMAKKVAEMQRSSSPTVAQPANPPKPPVKNEAAEKPAAAEVPAKKDSWFDRFKREPWTFFG